jgi:hypothetical protein
MVAREDEMLNKKNKGMRRRFRRALAKLQTNSLLIWRSRSGAISLQGQRTPSTAPWVSPHLLDQRSRVYRGQEHHARVCRIVSGVRCTVT